MNRIKTKIISAFPGMGKTYSLSYSEYKCLDLDSSAYSWTVKNGVKIKNKSFPLNYIDEIKMNIGKYDYILISSHIEVREELKNNCIFYYLLYPSIKRQDEFIERYIERGSTKEFIKLVSDNWYSWIEFCKDDTIGCCNLELNTSIVNDVLTSLRQSLYNKILLSTLLSDGWDGDDSYAPIPETINNILLLVKSLPEYYKVLYSDMHVNHHGTVTITWENKNDDMLSVEIGKEMMSYFTEFTVEGSDNEVTFNNNIMITQDSIFQFNKDLMQIVI